MHHDGMLRIFDLATERTDHEIDVATYLGRTLKVGVVGGETLVVATVNGLAALRLEPPG